MSVSTHPAPVIPLPYGTNPIENDKRTGMVLDMAVSPSLVAEDGATNLTYTFTRPGSMAAALVPRAGIRDGSALRLE